MSNGDRITGASPSKTALSESSLNEKALCDYVINVAEGCTHGCEFCYNKAAPQYVFDPGEKLANAGVEDPADEWGDYVLYRDDLPQHLARDLRRTQDNWRTTRRGGGVVGLSFGTDCYMDRRAAQITGAAVTLLANAERPIRILTRKPRVAAQLHGPLYEQVVERTDVTVGASIPALDEAAVAAIEPEAPSVEHRLAGLAQFETLGVPVYVSMSPTYPTASKADLRALLERITATVDPTVVFHEPINPRAGNLEDCVTAARAAGVDALADELPRLRDDESAWVEYALTHLQWVQEIATDLDVPIHLWPDATLAEKAPTAAEREWVQAWRGRPSPEKLGDSADGSNPYPDLPGRTHQTTL